MPWSGLYSRSITVGRQERSGAHLGLGTRGEVMGACSRVRRVAVERGKRRRDIRAAELPGFGDTAGVSVSKRVELLGSQGLQDGL